MSILIKGAEMPKDCGHCFFNDFNICQIEYFTVADAVYHGERHESCPLVEIPPHGRLVDADEYEMHLASIANTFARSDAQKSLMGRAIFCLENAPTVIESEEQERNIFLDESIDETAVYGKELNK